MTAVKRYAKNIFRYFKIPFCWVYKLEPIEKFTGVLCIVGALQLLAFIQSERAFVSISGANILNVGNESPLFIALDLKNSGRSVAIGDLQFYSRAKSLPPIPEYRDPLIINYTPVVAGGSSTASISAPVMDAASIADIRSGKLPFFIYGIIKFSDDYSFFGPRQVGFCLRYYAIGASLFSTCSESAYTYAK